MLYKNSVHWLPGNNHQFHLICVPNLSNALRRKAITFISNSCYYDDRWKRPTFIRLPQIKVDGSPKVTIKMSRMFKTAVGEGACEKNNSDLYRYQTEFEDHDLLMKNSSVRDIVTLASQVVGDVAPGFIAAKACVLYSLPRGKPQGVHADDYRSKEEKKNGSEMLTAIVSLMSGTTMDIIDAHRQRVTLQIPEGWLFLFSGDLVHGGSAYSDVNARLFIRFVHHTEQSDVRDDIARMKICPCTKCEYHKIKKVFTTRALVDHWVHCHRVEEELTMRQYIAVLNGAEKMTCRCGVIFVTGKGFKRHVRECKRIDSSNKASQSHIEETIGRTCKRKRAKNK